MSDKDIEFLRNTASSLNTDGSEKQFVDSLKEIQQKQYAVMNRGVTNGQTKSAPVNSPVYDATKAQLEKIKAERLKANK